MIASAIVVESETVPQEGEKQLSGWYREEIGGQLIGMGWMYCQW